MVCVHHRVTTNNRLLHGVQFTTIVSTENAIVHIEFLDNEGIKMASDEEFSMARLKQLFTDSVTNPNIREIFT